MQIQQNREEDLLDGQDTHHLEGRNINRGGEVTIDVMASPLRGARNIGREGTLSNVLPSRLQEEGIIGQEVPRLVNTIVQVADVTTSHQVAQCGEDHQLLGILHSSKTVFVVVINIRA